MGVIKRQAIKGSIYSYLGVVIGLLYTMLAIKLLQPEQIGILAILVAVSAIYSQFSTLGFSKVIERLFPYFRDEDNNHNGFLFLTVAVGIMGFVLSMITFFILKPWLIEKYQTDSSLFVEYIWYLIPLIFFRMFFIMFDTYNKMLFDATTGSILNDFVFRLGTLTLLGAFFLKWITFSQFVFFYVFFHCLPTLYLVGLLVYRKQFVLQPKPQFITPPLKKEIISLSLFGIIGGLSTVALKQIDTVMLAAYTNEATTGIYSILFYFSTVILIPGIALGKISSTIIADAWKKMDTVTIADIYYKSSINQLFVSLLLFILVVTNLHNILYLLGPRYGGTEWVIVLISLSSLMVSSTGSGVHIIGTSHKYKIQTYSLGVLVVLSVIFYMIFIPMLGMVGAALGSLLSLAGASLMRVIYMKRIMNLFPYRYTHVKCLMAGLLTFAIGKIIPVTDHVIIDLFFRSSVTSLLFVGLCYTLHISEDFNQVIHVALKQIQEKFSGKEN